MKKISGTWRIVERDGKPYDRRRIDRVETPAGAVSMPVPEVEPSVYVPMLCAWCHTNPNELRSEHQWCEEYNALLAERLAAGGAYFSDEEMASVRRFVNERLKAANERAEANRDRAIQERMITEGRTTTPAPPKDRDPVEEWSAGATPGWEWP